MKKGKTIKISPQGCFSTALKEALEAMGLSLTDLAQLVDSTYEHMRKLVAGRAHPSRAMLRRICSVLNADYDTWEELYERDKFHKEFGGVIPECLKLSDEMKPFAKLLNKLSPQGHAMCLAAAKALYEHDRRKQN